MRDDYASAIKLFRAAAARKPSGANMAGLASSRYHSGQINLEEFEKDMRVAMALDPDYLWAVRELGWVQAYAGRYDAAQQQFQAAIAKNEMDSNAQYGLAYVLTEQQSWDDAFDHVTRALELQPDYVSALSLRSLILLMLNRPKQAIKDADAVIAAWPDDDDGYVRKARAFDALGRRSEANAVLTAASRRADETSYLLFWQARLATDECDYATALKFIERSIKHEDASFHDHRLHAEIALGLKWVSLAREAIDQALYLRPGDSFVLYTNALVLIQEQRFEEAESAFDSAIDAGLDAEYLGDFLSALVGKGRFMQTIQVRVRYSDRKTSSPEGKSLDISN
ncbi:tetratricopeptide repeat protein [Ruegeria jejuensis]|uniref:tetratricopeptide repeat protein n=1 Tax=Ruegeria jejuensis TaxID=3233338 RepID=UPI00355BD4C1